LNYIYHIKHSSRIVISVIIFSLQFSPVHSQTFPGKIGINLGDAEWVDLVKQTNRYSNISEQDLGSSDLDENFWPKCDFRLVLLDARPVAEWSGEIDDPDLSVISIRLINLEGKVFYQEFLPPFSLLKEFKVIVGILEPGQYLIEIGTNNGTFVEPVIKI
jgi:hypothetical protein